MQIQGSNGPTPLLLTPTPGNQLKLVPTLTCHPPPPVPEHWVPSSLAPSKCREFGSRAATNKTGPPSLPYASGQTRTAKVGNRNAVSQEPIDCLLKYEHFHIRTASPSHRFPRPAREVQPSAASGR